MNNNGQMMITKGPMIPSDSSELALLASTSRMLEEAKTVDDFIDVRKMAKLVRAAASELKVHQKVLFEAACLTIRTEHGLGRLLSKLPLARSSPGNQRTGKVDRSHDGTGPLRLEDLGISKNASQRAQRIATIPEADLERWLAEQCEKGIEPTLEGAKRLANKLQPPDPGALAGKPGKQKQTHPSTKAVPTDDPLTSVQDALKHLMIVSEQIEPLYKPPSRSLKPVELRTIKRYLQELAKTLAGLECYYSDHPSSPSDCPIRGG